MGTKEKSRHGRGKVVKNNFSRDRKVDEAKFRETLDENLLRLQKM